MFHYTELTPKINTYCFFKLSPRKIKYDDLGIEVKLIDYNDLEVFLPITEINKKKFNITTFFKFDTIYPAIVYSIDNNNVSISYSKIKEEKRNQLLKGFEIQIKICKILSNLKNQFPNSTILNPIIIDFVDNNYDDIQKIYQNILLKPEYISTDEIVKDYIIKNRNIIKPIYEQYFSLIVIDINGIQILKDVLKEINNEYKVKIISSPLYCIEFNDLTLIDNIKEKIEKSIININCIYEIKELVTVKELEVDF
jgi:translation initiation factor 2 alpha subunit (eIF-2alpha)